MKVLVSAYSCEPGQGSEPGVGWNWVKEIARFHDVCVITRTNNRPSIKAALEKQPIRDIRWAYFDLPRSVSFWKKGPRGGRLYYYLWQIGIFSIARRLHHEVHFDLVHHLTFGKYSVPSFLSLLPAPFVWGPLGGGESFPAQFSGTFGFRGRVYEVLRHTAIRTANMDPFVRITARRAALALAKTNQTARMLKRLGCRRVVVDLEVAIPRVEIEALAARPRARHANFRAISIGRFLHWKGFHLGLMAFARFQQMCPGAEYILLGEGPETDNLRKLVQRLNLGRKVCFLGRLPRERTLAELSGSDVLVHPSLHDSGGWVCVEAMACGVPVVCLDLGGPSLQVTSATGFKVAANEPAQAVEDMARAMVQLALHPGLGLSMGEAGRKRVRDDFALENKGTRLTSLYEGIAGTTYPTTTAAEG